MTKVAIVGFARDGRAAYDYFNRDDNELTICDQNESIELPTGTKSQLGPNYLKNLGRFDIIVRTAGLPPRLIAEANPESPDILSKVTGNVDEFLKASPTKNIIGVTGTKGKGTTSTLIAKMLEAAGKKVYLGGNIGIPALELLKNNIQPDDWAVLEQSSFQLIDQKHSPHIGVCLSVEQEHLDWHRDMNEYLTAKQQLFINQSPDDIAIYNAENENSAIVTGVGQGKKIPYMRSPGAYVENDTIMIEGQTICGTDELKLLGKHNWQNVCAAVTAVWQVTQDIQAISTILTSFAGLEHRLEFVREVNNVKYYNDSFASAPPAPAAALEAIEGMKVIILGGLDRNLDLEDLVDAVKQNSSSIRKVLLVGTSANRLAKAFQDNNYQNFEITKANDMQDIVTQAQRAAQAGDSVILSPGFPSFDMFKDFEQRGKEFKATVNQLS